MEIDEAGMAKIERYFAQLKPHYDATLDEKARAVVLAAFAKARHAPAAATEEAESIAAAIEATHNVSHSRRELTAIAAHRCSPHSPPDGMRELLREAADAIVGHEPSCLSITQPDDTGAVMQRPCSCGRDSLRARLRAVAKPAETRRSDDHTSSDEPWSPGDE